MPFDIPTLPEVRALNRDYLASYLTGGPALPPNSRARVISDANAGLAFGAYQFIGRLAAEFLPDTAQAEFLLRWAEIYLGGQQTATFAEGAIAVTGTAGTILPIATQFAANGVTYETTEALTIGATATSVAVRALTPGASGNLEEGASLALVIGISGVDGAATSEHIEGGVDEESLERLRERVLARIRKPPMGGDADDYVAWARAVPGVTRAWCSPLEMGPGSVTVRFMMDDLRAANGGFPLETDIAAVKAHIDSVRPVAVRDCFVLAPVPQPINFALRDLRADDTSTHANIEASVAAMLRERAAPAYAVGGVRYDAQTIYASWISEAVQAAAGVERFTLQARDHPMPHNGSMAVLGNISIA